MLLQEYTKPGANEADVSARASAEATRIMLKTMGPCYKPTGYDSRGASAGYRGQIGPNSYFPHATMAALTFKPVAVITAVDSPAANILISTTNSDVTKSDIAIKNDIQFVRSFLPCNFIFLPLYKHRLVHI